LNDIEFCDWLVKEIGVAAIPLSPFYELEQENKNVRLCFAKSDDTLDAAAEKLRMLQ
jgi:methionine aminotransferase